MFTPPAVPAGAYDALVPHLRERSRNQVAWSADAGPLPTMFISHGAPPLLDDTSWMTELSNWSLALPKPRAILIVSAHWESAPLMLSSPQAGTELVYDFGGFASRYYSLQYRTPDAHELASLVASCIPDGTTLHQHTSRGLDHGAWVPLMVMYPLGDVPVLQMSLPTSDPKTLFALGERLRPLREAGVLIIGSGFMTHGLPFLTPQAIAGEVPGWSRDFDEWAAEALQTGDVETLSAFMSKAPGMPYAHPTVEHYVPMFVSLGAAAAPDVPPTQVIDGWFMGLSKRSFQAA